MFSKSTSILSKIKPNRSKPQNSTGFSVLLTPEIAELVLLEVPAVELLTTCRRVCRIWRDLIDTSSPKLRYYSLSGLDLHGQQNPDGQILTPLAIEVLSIFWKRLARKSITYGKPERERRQRRGLTRRLLGTRVGESSDDVPAWRENMVIYLSLLVFPVAAPVYLTYTFGGRAIKECGLRVREHLKLHGVQKLVNQFRGIFGKIKVFWDGQDLPEPLQIVATTNWKDTSPWWRERNPRFRVSDDSGNIPDPILTIMKYLGRAVYSYEPKRSAWGRLEAVLTVDLLHEINRNEARETDGDVRKYFPSTTGDSIFFQSDAPFKTTVKHGCNTRDYYGMCSIDI
ncbi:hypothetical protein TWF694_007377 [Orbilia ellipsospora]|uniref:F-box domain-containing protein n=1 Tax=Orbilia ellipsospora TaxID=2528407 RepID=A0AAV9XK76_9PEZI